MKKFIAIALIVIYGCKSDKNESVLDPAPIRDTITIIEPDKIEPIVEPPASNERFRKVKATKIATNSFRIEGEAQVFEAAFGWVVEDGHNQLAEGHETTSAGAPAWGKFSFLVNVEKEEPNSALHLVLFEESAKDGSRQYHLPIPLF